MKFITIFLIVFWNLSAFAQGISVLEPVASLYKKLQSYATKSNPARASLDTITFPPDKYGSSLLYVLVQPYYLSSEQVTVLKTWLPAPANSSDQTRAELDYLLELQAKRTPAQVERVIFLGDIGYWSQVDLLKSHPNYQRNLKDLFFEGQEVLGEDCSAEKYPKTAQLLKGVMLDMRIMEFSVKYQNLRPRPYHLEPKLEPTAVMGSPAFASGHTLWAFLQAYLWSELLPQKRADFLKLAEEIRQSREIMGIHYPSDNEAARVLAHKMLELMTYNAQFQQDFKEAASEWQGFKTASK